MGMWPERERERESERERANERGRENKSESERERERERERETREEKTHRFELLILARERHASLSGRVPGRLLRRAELSGSLRRAG